MHVLHCPKDTMCQAVQAAASHPFQETGPALTGIVSPWYLSLLSANVTNNSGLMPGCTKRIILAYHLRSPSVGAAELKNPATLI